MSKGAKTNQSFVVMTKIIMTFPLFITVRSSIIDKQKALRRDCNAIVLE